MRIKKSQLRKIIREELNRVVSRQLLKEELAPDNKNAEFVGEVDDEFLAAVGMGRGWLGEKYYVWKDVAPELGPDSFDPGDPYTYKDLGNSRYRVISGPYNPKPYPTKAGEMSTGRIIGTRPIGRIFTIRKPPQPVPKQLRTWFMVGGVEGASGIELGRPAGVQDNITSGAVGDMTRVRLESAVDGPSSLGAALRVASAIVSQIQRTTTHDRRVDTAHQKIPALEDLIADIKDVADQASKSTSPASLGRALEEIVTIRKQLQGWTRGWRRTFDPHFQDQDLVGPSGARVVLSNKEDIQTSYRYLDTGVKRLEEAEQAIENSLTPQTGKGFEHPTHDLGTALDT